MVKLGRLSLSQLLIEEVDSFSDMLPSLSELSGDEVSEAVTSEISKIASQSIKDVYKNTDTDPTDAIQREFGKEKVIFYDIFWVLIFDLYKTVHFYIFLKVHLEVDLRSEKSDNYCCYNSIF